MNRFWDLALLAATWGLVAAIGGVAGLVLAGIWCRRAVRSLRR
jgi:hypothetical protein